jgi:ribose transport system substrate-binding protein
MRETFLKWVVAMATLALFAGVIAGRAEAQEKKKITIGLVAKSQSNPVFQAAYKGAQDAAKELGPKYNAEVTIDWQTPASEDAQKQAQAIEQLSNSGAAGSGRCTTRRRSGRGAPSPR